MKLAINLRGSLTELYTLLEQFGAEKHMTHLQIF